MKTLLSLTVSTLLLSSSMAFAQANTPVIDQRQANQEQRIDQGIASGELTKREAHRLDKQEDHIDKMENRAKADGKVTKRERARIRAAQDRTSGHIAKQKHDAQHR